MEMYLFIDKCAVRLVFFFKLDNGKAAALELLNNTFAGHNLVVWCANISINRSLFENQNVASYKFISHNFCNCKN